MVALVLVYDYHPLATTLHAKYFSRPDPLVYDGIRPDTLWSFVVQLTSAIKAVHDSHLAVRVLDLSKILITSPNRIRVNCCGIFDILMYDERLPISRHQV